jgi:hypothetical protein
MLSLIRLLFVLKVVVIKLCFITSQLFLAAHHFDRISSAYLHTTQLAPAVVWASIGEGAISDSWKFQVI